MLNHHWLEKLNHDMFSMLNLHQLKLYKLNLKIFLHIVFLYDLAIERDHEILYHLIQLLIFVMSDRHVHISKIEIKFN